MGEQAARVYYRLGKVSDNMTYQEKGNKMMEDEILRYAGYLRFYQSLSASQYERLSRIDKFIDQQYMLDLMADYGQQCGDEQYEKLADKLAKTGLNMQRLQSFQQAYEESLKRQYMQQAAAQQATEE